MMDIEILHGELERLFELDELLRLSESVLGFEPNAVGGASAKGSFAGSLTAYCVEHDALEALCDAVLAIKPDASPKLAELRLGSAAHDDDLRLGDALGPYTIARKIGEGRLGVTYLARKEEQDFRLKVLRSAAVRDRRGVQRFLTVVRVIAGIEHAGLPKRLTAERAEHRVYVAHEYVEGQPLSARIGRSGPMHINEARDILRAVLEPLQAIHQRRLAHGDLRLENLISYRDADGQPRIVLLDAGADRLRIQPNMRNGHAEFFAGVLSPRTVAPEQVRGLSSDPRSDVYSFGALLYEILSGKPLFADKNPVLAAVAHLTEVPPPPSSVAPRGWVSSEVDDFVLALLARDPDKRPQNAGALLEALEKVGKSEAAKPEKSISDEDLDKRCEALANAPLDGEVAIQLEASVDEGADPSRVAEAFASAAQALEPGEDEAKRSAKKSLLFRAARLFQNRAKAQDKAEQMYVALVELDPSDEIAAAALEDVRRQLGKYEELIEMLVVRSEQATDSVERARAFAEIGSVYKDDLDDEEQAVVAFTQALCADPEHNDYAELIERHAKKRAETWNEVLGVCAQAVADESISAERKHALLLTMGRWYGEKLQRSDLALPCLQAVLQDDPAHQTALEAMTQIYRKSQQWPELVLVLRRRADATVVASRGRELKAEAAEVLEHQLNDAGGARDLYEQILAADPFHHKASIALAKIYERTGDFAGQVRILESRLLALRGDEKLKEMCRIAEVYEDRLNDDEEAVRRFQAVLVEDANHLEALRGLDRLFSKGGRYRELLDNLKAQAALAVTPRQKITLWERAAAIHDEEFLDHKQAAEALEQVLEIDGAHEDSIAELVRHYRALDRWEDVTALYERQLKLITQPEQRVEILLSLGRVFSEQIGSPDRATSTYERVLEINPEHAGALEALARLRESAGDADAALKAIESLAVKATSGEAKAEQYLRAAKLLEGRGDRDGAVERYKMALDANPKDVAAALALRSAFLARGDVNAAMQLLDREIQQTEGDRAKAKLAGEMAILARDRLKDDKRAKEAAERALSFDPTNLDALTILGDLAFDAKRHLEAAKHYEVLAERAATLDKREAARVLVRFVDALSQTGSTEKALAPMDTLLRIAPDDLEALERVAYVTFEHGSPKRAVELYADIIERFTDQLHGAQRAGIAYRYGEALRRSENFEKALGYLEESADLDPSNPAPLVALAKTHEARSDWEQVVKTKSRHLDLANGDERVQLLVEIGEIASSKLNDRTQAAKNFVAALDERPDDRRLLGKLMQLYSEEKDWNKLVEVVLRLAEFVDDPLQKAKYLHTAANITGRQIGDADRALEFYDQALALDGTMDKALDEAIELQRDRGEHRAVEPLLKRRLERATAAKDEAAMLTTFSELGELYEKKLGWVNEAIDAFEAAQTLDPDNRERAAHLAQLYITDPEKYLDKAVASQEAILRQNPYRPESYKLLRRLYTEVKRADAAWCLCQGLFVLNLAEPDEERFFKRMRADTAAPAQQALTDEDWLRLVMHPDADPLLTSVFALIEPAVIGRRGQTLEELGYDPRYAIDLSMHPYPMSQTLHYAAGVLGMEPPPTFQNMNDPGGLSFLHAHSPSIVLGVAALSANVPPQAAAFIAARHLTYFRPGMYLRHLVPTGTGLKSWLFAAIKLNAPQFPVSPDLEGPVREALQALEAGLPGQTRDHLSRVVSKLIQSGAALDLKKWVAGVDLTADRAGTLVAHDLETAAEIIKASEEGSSAVSNQDRLKELVLYAVSEPFFELRQTLGVAIDS